MARRALRGPKWVMPLATPLNSSSNVCHTAHSSSVMYLHPDRHSLVFFGGGEGKRGFFVVLSEVVDNEVGSKPLVWPPKAFHNRGGQCGDVLLQVDADARSERECLAVTVINGTVTLTALDFCSVVITASVLTSELDDSWVGGVANGGREVTRRCHHERARVSWSWRQASAIVFQKGRPPAAVFAKSSWSGGREETATFTKVSLVSGLLVKGVNHSLGDGLTLRFSHCGFCIGGCFGGVIVCAGPGISGFFGVKVPVCSRRRASRHRGNANG